MVSKINVPEELAAFLEVEDCSNFNEKRYFVTADQAALIKDILRMRKVTNKMREEYKIGYLNSTLLYGPTGTGKAQPLSSKVLTPGCFKKIKDLKVGDEVVSLNGIAKIQGVYPQGVKDIYELTTSAGRKCRCSLEHLWSYRIEGSPNKSNIDELSVIIEKKKNGEVIMMPIYIDGSIYYESLSSVKKVGREECQCIYIDDESHMYVTDDMILTHNTTLCKYIAYKMQLNYVFLNFAKIVDGMFGQTARNIDKVFKFMAETECIFVLDEIDCIATKRGNESAASGGELSRITITLMQELDYYKVHKVDSIIIGCTNVIELLDPALRSRFAMEKEIRLLSNQEKEGYILKYLKDVGIEYDEKNVREYCARNSMITQRNIESDMERAIANKLYNNEDGPIKLERIKNK